MCRVWVRTRPARETLSVAPPGHRDSPLEVGTRARECSDHRHHLPALPAPLPGPGGPRWAARPLHLRRRPAHRPRPRRPSQPRGLRLQACPSSPAACATRLPSPPSPAFWRAPFRPLSPLASTGPSGWATRPTLPLWLWLLYPLAGLIVLQLCDSRRRWDLGALLVGLLAGAGLGLLLFCGGVATFHHLLRARSTPAWLDWQLYFAVLTAATAAAAAWAAPASEHLLAVLARAAAPIRERVATRAWSGRVSLARRPVGERPGRSWLAHLPSGLLWALTAGLFFGLQVALPLMQSYPKPSPIPHEGGTLSRPPLRSRTWRRGSGVAWAACLLLAWAIGTVVETLADRRRLPTVVRLAAFVGALLGFRAGPALWQPGALWVTSLLLSPPLFAAVGALIALAIGGEASLARRARTVLAALGVLGLALRRLAGRAAPGAGARAARAGGVQTEARVGATTPRAGARSLGRGAADAGPPRRQ